tara:strand:- start:3701 stop:4621 length:921 start_codon:yes stop_codon:yes gene_type:complete
MSNQIYDFFRRTITKAAAAIITRTKKYQDLQDELNKQEAQYSLARQLAEKARTQQVKGLEQTLNQTRQEASEKLHAQETQHQFQLATVRNQVQETCTDLRERVSGLIDRVDKQDAESNEVYRKHLLDILTDGFAVPELAKGLIEYTKVFEELKREKQIRLELERDRFATVVDILSNGSKKFQSSPIAVYDTGFAPLFETRRFNRYTKDHPVIAIEALEEDVELQTKLLEKGQAVKRIEGFRIQFALYRDRLNNNDPIGYSATLIGLPTKGKDRRYVKALSAIRKKAVSATEELRSLWNTPYHPEPV